MTKYQCPNCEQVLEKSGDLEYFEKKTVTSEYIYDVNYKTGEKNGVIRQYDDSYEAENRKEIGYRCGYCGDFSEELDYFELVSEVIE